MNYPGEWVMHGLPKVRTQDGPYCAFNAIAYYVEMLTGVVINIPPYVSDYIMELRMSGCYKNIEVDTLKEIRAEMTDLEVFENELGNDRAIKALEMLKNRGVMAEQNGLQGRVRISRYECHPYMNFRQVCDMLNSGVPILGCFPVWNDFSKLTSNIYELSSSYKPAEDEKSGSHLVMFVGYGHSNGRPFLVFLNSYGTKWGTNGLGRIYFDQVYQLGGIDGYRFITLEVSEMGTALPKDLISPELHFPPSKLTNQTDDKQALRFEM
jgi:hypothetical protein